MKKNEITGTALTAIGLGLFFYLFIGYIKPRIDSAKQQKNPSK